jgi:putative lipoprotein
MKKIVLLFLLVIFFSSCVFGISIDKYKHFSVSMTLDSIGGIFLGKYRVPFALSIGAGKEIYDLVSGKGHAEWGDFFADVAGVVACEANMKENSKMIMFYICF